MAKPQSLSITIHNWDKFNPRKDVKASSWFRLEHSLFEDPEFFDLTHPQLLFWIYLLSNASKKNGDTFTLSFAHAERVGRFKLSDINEAIDVLTAAGRIYVNDTPTLRPRDVPVTDTNATNERTRRDETNERDGTGTDSFSAKELLDFWNETCGSLPKARDLTDDRKRKAQTQLKKYPDKQHWIDALAKFLTSAFCVDEWKPGFDDFLREPIRTKALEGKYDRKLRAVSGSPPKTREQLVMDHNRSQYERVMKGEL